MKALVYKGSGQVALEDKPMPEVVEPTDAVVKSKYAVRSLLDHPICFLLQSTIPFSSSIRANSDSQ